MVKDKAVTAAILSLLNLHFWYLIGNSIQAISMNVLPALMSIGIYIALNRIAFFIITCVEIACDSRFEKEHKYLPSSNLIKEISQLGLEKIENSETSLVFSTASLHFQKAQDAREFLGVLSSIGVYTIAFFGVSFYLKLPILLIVFVPLIVSYGIGIIGAKASQGFWKQYNSNARRFNYFSDVLLKPEYAQERKTFNTFGFFNNYFVKEFDFASKLNAKLAYHRFKFQSISEVLLIAFSIISLFLLMTTQRTAESWLGQFTFLSLIVSAIAVTSSSFFDLFPKFRDYQESLHTITNFHKTDSVKN